MSRGPAYMTQKEFLEFVDEVWAGLREMQSEKFDGEHHVEDLGYSYVRAIEATQVVLDILQFRLKHQPAAAAAPAPRRSPDGGVSPMPRLTLTLDLDSDAFADDLTAGVEVARILTRAAFAATLTSPGPTEQRDLPHPYEQSHPHSVICKVCGRSVLDELHQPVIGADIMEAANRATA